MNQPLVSIITVVYNNKDGIAKTIESVLGQNYANIEYIIIDGNSDDGTYNVIESYASGISKIISEPDKGIYDAMNKGIKLANGMLVGIINSGDYYEKDCVDNIVKTYINDISADIFHGVLRVLNADGSFKLIIGNNHSFLTTGMIEHPTCFIKKEIYDKIGMFDIKYKSSADYEFMLRALSTTVRFAFIEVILANFFEGGISSQKVALLETLEIRQKYRLISQAKRMIMFALINLKFALKN